MSYDTSGISRFFIDMVYVDQNNIVRPTNRTERIKRHFLKQANESAELYIQENFISSNHSIIRERLHEQIIGVYDLFVRSCYMATVYSRHCPELIRQEAIHPTDLFFYSMASTINNQSSPVANIIPIYTIITHRRYSTWYDHRPVHVYSLRFADSGFHNAILMARTKGLVYMFESPEQLCRRDYFQENASSYNGVCQTIGDYISRHPVTYQYIHTRLPSFSDIIRPNS